MTTDLTLEMNMSMWSMFDTQTLIKLVKFLKEVKPQALTPYTMRYLG